MANLNVLITLINDKLSCLFKAYPIKTPTAFFSHLARLTKKVSKVHMKECICVRMAKHISKRKKWEKTGYNTVDFIFHMNFIFYMHKLSSKYTQKLNVKSKPQK